MKKILLCFVAVAMLSACGPDTQSSVSDWNGQWTGPEGTYLKIESAAKADAVTVKIRNLDGERSFDGIVQNGRIAFERDGKQETIRGGTGEETGMKWLADKKECLVITTGEGYCRS